MNKTPNYLKQFSKDSIEWAKENPEKVKQHIRDLYDKMFPATQDYIQFLRQRWLPKKSILKINVHLQKQEYEEKIKYWKKVETNFHKDDILYDRLSESDYWHNITTEEKNNYVKLTEAWLETKTKQQRTIWNYYILDVPKKKIATRLKKEQKHIRIIINKLQENFLKQIISY